MKVSLAVAALSCAFVQTATAEIQYPYIAPNCNYTIVTPPEQNGFYMSENCKTVYLMPSVMGKATVGKISKIASLQRCAGLKDDIDTDNLQQAQILALTKKMYALDIEDPRRAEYRHEIELIKKDRVDLFSGYDVLGAIVPVYFTLPSTQERMEKFLIANANTLISNGIQVQDMPVGESYLSFINKNDTTGGLLRPVLALDIPQVSALRPDGTADMSAVHMNGSVTGQISLSLSGICPMVWDKDFDATSLSSFMTVNLTYKVPLLTSAGYDAELDTDIATNALVNAWQNKTQFSVSQGADIIATGSGGQAFKYQGYNLGVPDLYSKDSKDAFFATVRADVLKRLTQNLLDQMTAAGFLELNKPTTIPDAPAPGYIDEVHSGHSCESDGPFGLFGSSCSDYTYTVKVPHGSSMNYVSQKIADLHFVNRESVSDHEIVQRVYTAGFKGE